MKNRIKEIGYFCHFFFVELVWKDVIIGMFWELILMTGAFILLVIINLWKAFVYAVTFKWMRSGVPDIPGYTGDAYQETPLHGHPELGVAQKVYAEGQVGGPPRPRPTPKPRKKQRLPKEFVYEEALNRLREFNKIKIILKSVEDDGIGMVELFERVLEQNQDADFGETHFIWKRIGVGKTLEAAVKYAIMSKG